MRKNRMKIRLCSMVLAAQFLFSSMAAPALAVEASGVELAAQSQQAEEQTEAMTAPEPQTEAGEEALTGMAEETKPETELQETVKDPSASDAGTQAGQSEGATGAAQTDESTAESGETAKNAETAAETVKDPEVGSENDGSGQQTPAEIVEKTEKSSEADAAGEQSGSEEAQTEAGETETEQTASRGVSSEEMNQILVNSTVTLMKNGEKRTDTFTQDETSVDVQVKLDSSLDKTFLKIYGYAGNTSFDPDGNFNKVLWSGWVSDGFTQTCEFNASQLPLPVGYKIIACLNVLVDPETDFYRPSVSQALEVVDESGNGFEDYEYPDASIDEKELKPGATSLHISLIGDERLFQAAREGKTTLTVSVAQYPGGDDFDFESSDQISLVRLIDATEAFSGREVTFSEPLREGYRVRAVVFWDQNADIYLPKGNDYEASFHMPDDSVLVIGDPSVAIAQEVKNTDSTLKLNLGGAIPEGAMILLKQYPAGTTSFATTGGTWAGSSFNVVRGEHVMNVSGLEKGSLLVAFLLNNGTLLAQSEPMAVTALPDFAVSLVSPVTTESSEISFRVTAQDESISKIMLAAVCRVDENGKADATDPNSYIARLFGQAPGVLTFSGISGLNAGEKVRLVLKYNNGDSVFESEDFTVQAPMAVDTLMLQEQSITTDQDEINVVVFGCDRFKGGFLILTTGSSVTDGDGDSRDRVGSARFNGEGTYRFYFNKGTLKAGNTVQAHLYIYDGDSDRTYYQYSPSVLVQGSGSTVQEASVEIVTDEIRADRTDVRVKAQFGPDATAALKLYTWSGETFDAELATLIRQSEVRSSENSQKITFEKGQLKAGDKLTAVLELKDGTTSVSSAKVISAEPEKVQPQILIKTQKLTAGMSKISGWSNFDSSDSPASYKLYQFTGETLDTEHDEVIAQGSVYYYSRGGISVYCLGKLKAGAKVQLVLTAGEQQAFSNVREVEPSPDWGTPTAAFEVSAVKSSDKSVDVTVDYSDEYLTMGDDFYCDVTVYQFSGDYTDQEFEDNEMWEQLSRVTSVGKLNSRLGDETKGRLTVTFRDGVTLTPGNRLIIKLRLPHTEWEDEEVDYVSASVPIVDENQQIAVPRVLLYHLNEDTSLGVRLREILAEQGIEAVDVSESQLNQKVGYLSGIDGYEQADGSYDGEAAQVQFMLMANFSEAALDRFLAAMTAAGIRIDHKAVTTAYNVDYEFHELIDDIREEHPTFQALLVLSQLVNDAKKLTQEQYGSVPQWEAFTEALAEANQVLASEEPSLETLQNADQKLRALYLELTGMKPMEGNAVITVTAREDDLYDLTVSVSGVEDQEGYIYTWNSGETGATLSGLTKSALITKTVTVTGENRYGKLTAQLRVPEAPQITVVPGQKMLRVQVSGAEESENCPAAESFVVSLYQDGKLIGVQPVEASGARSTAAAVFTDLEDDTVYTAKAYAVSAVGRSDAVSVEGRTQVKKDHETETPATDEPGTEQPGTETPDTETPATETPATDEPATDEPEETETETKAETETEKKNPDSRNDKTDQNSRNNQKNTGAPKTGDDTGMMLWVWILLSAGGAAAALIIYRKRETI